MNIVGVDDIVFGVEDFEAAKDFCRDFGLAKVDSSLGTTATMRPASTPRRASIRLPETASSFCHPATLNLPARSAMIGSIGIVASWTSWRSTANSPGR